MADASVRIEGDNYFGTVWIVEVVDRKTPCNSEVGAF